MLDTNTTEPQVRPVTDAEVSTFWENGWVKLPSLIDRQSAAKLLARAKSVFGEDGRLGLEPVADVRPQGYDYRTWFRSHFGADQLGADVFSVARSRRLGHNVARLYGRDSCVRVLLNNFQVKLPRDSGVGEATVFHQDTPGFLYVEGAIISIWMAIDEVTADMGGLQFRTGAHKLGYLGTMQGWEERLNAFPLTPPMILQPGDATAHIGNMYHGTGPNMTDRPRWSWTSIMAPGDARYTGAKSPYGDNLGLEPGQILDHPSAPIIYAPGNLQT